MGSKTIAVPVCIFIFLRERPPPSPRGESFLYSIEAITAEGIAGFNC